MNNRIVWGNESKKNKSKCMNKTQSDRDVSGSLGLGLCEFLGGHHVQELFKNYFQEYCKI